MVKNDWEPTNQLHGEKPFFWEINNSSRSQKIPCILWNPKVHYHVCNSLPLVAILSQVNPVHAPPLCFCKIHFNITLPMMPRYSKWSLSLRFSHQSTLCISLLSHRYLTLHSPYPPSLDHLNNIWWAVQTMTLLIMQFSPVSCYLPSS
jgi:hypothetical protein